MSRVRMSKEMRRGFDITFENRRRRRVSKHADQHFAHYTLGNIIPKRSTPRPQ